MLFVNNPACNQEPNEEPFTYVDPWDGYSPHQGNQGQVVAQDVQQINKDSIIAKDTNQEPNQHGQRVHSSDSSWNSEIRRDGAAPPPTTSPQHPPRNHPPEVVQHCHQQETYSTKDQDSSKEKPQEVSLTTSPEIPDDHHHSSPPTPEKTAGGSSETDVAADKQEKKAEEVGSQIQQETISGASSSETVDKISPRNTVHKTHDGMRVHFNRDPSLFVRPPVRAVTAICVWMCGACGWSSPEEIFALFLSI